MKKVTYLMLIALLISFGKKVHAQLYPVNITEKVMNANLIVEGKVVSQQSFWNEAHTLIFTSNTIELYKSFKGQVPAATVEVLTQGGVVDNQAIEVSDLGQLTIGDKGIFFLYPNTIRLKSPSSGRLLYDIYASDQGILRYSVAGNQAYCPFGKYDGITSKLYNQLRTLTGEQPTVIDSRYNVDEEISAGNVQGQRLDATITSTSPAIVHAGAILDPANNVLTINGSGFGNSRGNKFLLFKDANNSISSPNYKLDSNAYYIDWSPTVIKVKVPARAASGRFGIYFSPGDTAFAPQPLKVRFSVMDVILEPSSRVQEPRLVSNNGAGGYNIFYSAVGNDNITTLPVYNTFKRALATWKETAGANFYEAGNTSIQRVDDDALNIIMLDNGYTGEPRLADGVLAVTYSHFKVCPSGVFNTAQKTGFDIIIRNQGISLGANIGFEYGPCPPAFVNPGLTDMETVLLHELGHALNLAHVNDPQEMPGAPFNPYLHANPAGLMHYTLDKWLNRRSPDESAYSGALYTITPRGVSLGNCLASTEMVRLPTLVPSNDNCPIVFPTAYTAQGTSYNMDLVHATSNNAVDPQYTAANCSQPISVTNNVYQVIRTSYNGSLDLTISNYATTPTPLPDSCGMNKGVGLSIYDVASCPTGQAFPAPVKCLNFIGNGTMPTITGLAAKKTYLLFFEGVRNTKATFTVKLSGGALAVSKSSLRTANLGGGSEYPTNVTLGVVADVDISLQPNPFQDFINVTTRQKSSNRLTVVISDVVSRNVAKSTFNSSAQISTASLAKGTYLVSVYDASGHLLATKKC